MYASLAEVIDFLQETREINLTSEPTSRVTAGR